MMKFEKDNTTFEVDYEKTQEYYKHNSLCDCSSCRNLYAQIKNAVPNLDAFLSEFGVDISRPDECCSVEMDNYIDYLFVGYTVTGKMINTENYETDVDGLKIEICSAENCSEWFPNEQTEPCFYITVTGLSLPWVLDEPFPN